MTLSVNLSIMLINDQIIPINDQMMHTEVIMVPIFMTEIVVFQISLNSNHLQIQETMINTDRKQIYWISQEKLQVVKFVSQFTIWLIAAQKK